MRPSVRRSIRLLFSTLFAWHSAVAGVVEARLLKPPASSAVTPIPRLIETIPAFAATVRETRDGAGPAVLIIQDVHLNGEAQTNIAETLASLSRARLIDFIGVEGAFRRWDVSAYRNYPDQDTLRRVARAFLSAGRLAAPSFAAVTGEARVPIAGVDDRRLHAENVGAYQRALKNRERLERRIGKLDRRVAELARRVLREDLRSWNEQRAAFTGGRMKLSEYVRTLAGLTTLTPMLARFREAHALESEMDLNRVEAERRRVIEKLADRLDRRRMAELLADGTAYRLGRIGFGDFYGRLKARCAEAGVTLSGAPEFQRYLRYAELADALKAETLIDELATAERRLVRERKPSSAEWHALDTSRRLQLLRRLVRFELTPAEWEEVKTPMPANDGASRRRPRSELAALDPDLAPHRAFYEAAERRSAAMVRNALRRPASSARAIVVGGFHAPQMARLLRRKGLPYAVVTPRLSKVDGEATGYLSAFSRDRTPLDRLFAGEAIFVNPTTVNIEEPALDRHLRLGAALLTARGLPVGQTRRLAGISADVENLGDGVTRARVPGSGDVWAADENPDPARYISLGPKDPAGLEYFLPADAADRTSPARRMFERVRARVLSWIGRGGWDGFMNDLAARQGETERFLVERALSELAAAGVRSDGLAERIVLVDRLDETELEGDGGRVGGVLVRHRGVVKILLPRHRLLFPSRRTLSDVLHELVEVELLQNGTNPDAAHAAALSVQLTFLRSGAGAAAREWQARRGDSAAGSDAREIAADGVIGAMHDIHRRDGGYEDDVSTILHGASGPVVWGSSPSLGRVVNVNALLEKLPRNRRSIVRQQIAEAMWDLYSRGFQFDIPRDMGVAEIKSGLMSPETILLGLFDETGTLKGFAALHRKFRVRKDVPAADSPFEREIGVLVVELRDFVGGRGTLLFDATVAQAKALGFRRLSWRSTAEAEGFYRRILRNRSYSVDDLQFELDISNSGQPEPAPYQGELAAFLETEAGQSASIGVDPELGSVVDAREIITHLETSGRADLAADVIRRLVAVHQNAFGKSVDVGHDPTQILKLARERFFRAKTRLFFLVDRGGEIQGYAFLSSERVKEPIELRLLAAEPTSTFRGRGRLLFYAVLRELAARGVREMQFTAEEGAVGFYHRVMAGRFRYWTKNPFSFFVDPTSERNLSPAEADAQLRFLAIVEQHRRDVENALGSLIGEFDFVMSSGRKLGLDLPSSNPELTRLVAADLIYNPGARLTQKDGTPALPSLAERLADAGLETGPPLTRPAEPPTVPDGAALSLFPDDDQYTRNWAWIESVGLAAGALLALALFAASLHPAAVYALSLTATLIWLPIHALIDHLRGVKTDRDWTAMAGGALVLHTLSWSVGMAAAFPFAGSIPLALTAFSATYGAVHAGLHFGWNRRAPRRWALSFVRPAPDDGTDAAVRSEHVEIVRRLSDANGEPLQRTLERLLTRLMAFAGHPLLHVINAGLLNRMIAHLRDALREPARFSDDQRRQIAVAALETTAQVLASQSWLAKTMRSSGLRQRGPWQGDGDGAFYLRQTLETEWVEHQLGALILGAPAVHLQRNLESLVTSILLLRAVSGPSWAFAQYYVSPRLPAPMINALREVSRRMENAGFYFPMEPDDAVLDTVTVGEMPTIFATADEIGDVTDFMSRARDARRRAQVPGVLRIFLHAVRPLSHPPESPMDNVMLVAIHDLGQMIPGFGRLAGLAAAAIYEDSGRMATLRSSLAWVRSFGTHIDELDLETLGHILLDTRRRHRDESDVASPEEVTDPDVLRERFPDLSARYRALLAAVEALPSSELRGEIESNILSAIEFLARDPDRNLSEMEEVELREIFQSYRTLVRHVIFLGWRARRDDPDAAARTVRRLDAHLTDMHRPPTSENPPATASLVTSSGMASAKVLLFALSRMSGNSSQATAVFGTNIYFEVLMIVRLMRQMFRAELIRERNLSRTGSAPVSASIDDDVSIIFLDPAANNIDGREGRDSLIGDQDDAPVTDIQNVLTELRRRPSDKLVYLCLDITFQGPTFRPEALFPDQAWPENLVLITYGSLQKLYENGLDLSTGGMINVYAPDAAVRDRVIGVIKDLRNALGAAPSLHQAMALRAVLGPRSAVTARAAMAHRAAERVAQTLQEEVIRRKVRADVIHPSLPTHADYDIWLANDRPGVPVVWVRFATPDGWYNRNKRFLELLHGRLSVNGLGGIEMRDSFGFNELSAAILHKAPNDALRIAVPPAGPVEMDAIERSLREAVRALAAEERPAPALSLLPGRPSYTDRWAWLESIGVAALAMILLLGVAPSFLSYYVLSLIVTAAWLPVHALIDRITGYEGKRNWAAMAGGALAIHTLASGAAWAAALPFAATSLAMPLAYAVAYAVVHSALHFGWNRRVPASWALSMAPQAPGGEERRALLEIENKAYDEIVRLGYTSASFDDKDARIAIDEIIKTAMNHDWAVLSRWGVTAAFVRLRERLRYRIEGRMEWAPERIDDQGGSAPPAPGPGAGSDLPRVRVIGDAAAAPFEGDAFVTTAHSEPDWVNADYSLVDRDLGILIVADGVGNNPGAPEASLEGATRIHRTIAAGIAGVTTVESLEQLIESAIADARTWLIENREQTHRPKMNTTIAVAVQWNGWLIGRKLGNSRIYRLRNGALERLGGVNPGATVAVPGRDDSLIETQVERGLITEEEAYDAPMRNVLMATLSDAGNYAESQKIRVEVAEGDLFLGMSDGVTDNLKPAELAAAAASAADVASIVANVASAAMRIAAQPREDVSYRSRDDIAAAGMKARAPGAKPDASVRQAAETILEVVGSVLNDQMDDAVNALGEERRLGVDGLLGGLSSLAAGRPEDLYGNPEFEELLLSGMRARGLNEKITPENAPMIYAVLAAAGAAAVRAPGGIKSDVDAGKTPVVVLDRREPIAAVRAAMAAAGEATLIVRPEDAAYYRSLRSRTVAVIEGSPAFFRGSKVRMELLRGQLPAGTKFDLGNLLVIVKAGTPVDMGGLSDDELRSLRIALLDELLASCRLMNAADLRALDRLARTILSQA